MSKQSKKWLTPTKNPFPSMAVRSGQYINCSSLNATNQRMRTQSCKSKQEIHKWSQKILKVNCDLKRFSSTEHIINHPTPNRGSKFCLINNKIESFLKIYEKTKSQSEKQKQKSKDDGGRMRRSKENKQYKIIRPRQNKENKQQSPLKQKSNKKPQIPKLALKDITITNISINYPINPKIQKSDKLSTKVSSFVVPAILLPKKSKPSNKVQIKSKKLNSGGPTVEDQKMGNLSLGLEQLQNSESHIDSILTSLEKNYLPKNTDFFVYNEQQIKVPKIFRKSKANNQMYKSCTEVQNKIKDSCIQAFKSVLIEKSTMRKGSMSQSLSLIERQLNNFLMGLKTQICLDSEFKKMKQWFLYSKTQDKWRKLEQQLRSNSLWVNQLTMKVIFLCQNQEGNPFQSAFKQEYSIKQLVITFKTAELHWNEYILNKFDDKLLKGAGFTQDVLDSSKKGYISIQDLIRFMHCKLKEFYYTRDLNMIYLRLKGGEKLQYEQMLTKISINPF